MTIAVLDVHYGAAGARAACVLIDSWESESPRSMYVQGIDSVEPYEPGNFYRRELPCLLSVLRLPPSRPDTVVIDGYVWLPVERPGLGVRLYEALGTRTAVVGIAKTAFAGAESCAAVVQVFRGTSRSPLFVTAIGMEPGVAAECVRRMAGKHRVPEIVRLTDGISRRYTEKTT